jgi:hypothetical protein
MINLFGYSRKFWKKSNSYQKLMASKMRILIKIWATGNTESMKNFVNMVSHRYFDNCKDK